MKHIKLHLQFILVTIFIVLPMRSSYAASWVSINYDYKTTAAMVAALFAENEGLAIYEKIANRLEEFLTDSGQAFFEIGFNQGASVQRIFSSACPNREVTIHKDIAGMDRMIIVSGKEAQ
mgnify:CR=1 FL=1